MTSSAPSQAEILWAVSLGAYLIARTHNVISDRQMDELIRTTLEIVDDLETTPDDIAELFGAHEELFRAIGFDNCVARIGQHLRDHPLRKNALVVAASMACLEGEATHGERDALRTLGLSLGFTHEQTDAVMQELRHLSGLSI